MVKNMSLALVSGGNLVVLEGSGKVGEGGLTGELVSRTSLPGLGKL